MVILQHTLADSIRYRRSEWGAAAALCEWGAILLLPYPSFAGSPSTVVMASWMTEDHWGATALLVGIIRMGVLVYNGRWKKTNHARMALAGISCFFWMGLSIGLLSAGTFAASIAFTITFFAMDLHTVYEAASDARSADESHSGLTA